VQGRGYGRALRASFSYFFKKKINEIFKGKVDLSAINYRCSKGYMFCVGGGSLSAIYILYIQNIYIILYYISIINFFDKITNFIQEYNFRFFIRYEEQRSLYFEQSVSSSSIHTY
jgi:hypothetical protein